MPLTAASPFDSSSRRLAVYGYLAPLVAGRRVVEVGTGAGAAAGAGAQRLRALGASAVLGLDQDSQRVSRARSNVPGPGVDFRALERRTFDAAAGAFDVVVVPDGASVLQVGAAVTPQALRGLCGPRGHVALIVESADRPGADGGAGYYEAFETLSALFPRVRMFGLTPFAAFGIAEFSETPAGLRIDGGLVDESGEQPSHYLAIAGPDVDVSRDDDFELGYALMQIAAEAPAAAGGVADSSAGKSAPATVDVLDLRHRLAEAEGKTEGLLRVSRAQVEEIEELRARLRRSAESRAELDQEMTRLRRALAEADESVLNLTRRTTQEMASLAQRITAGLRPDGGGGAGARPDDATPVARLREELRRREEELAATESALSERDDRVAVLEAEKQDLDWRLATAQAGARPAAGPRLVNDDAAAQRQRELALEQYRQAAAAHLEEVGRLREALAEQSTLVAELEEGIASGAAKQAEAQHEAERLRRHLAEVEEADRARRSRLAEVEGTLLRLQRQTALAAAARAEASGAEAAPAPIVAPTPVVAPAPVGPSSREWEQRLEATNAEWQRKIDALTEQLNAAADAPVNTQPGGGALQEAQREIARLRHAVERAEEQLWETKGQLLLDRERMAVLEHELAAGPSEPIVTEAAHQSIMTAVYKELADLENGVRAEIVRLDTIESVVEGWRNDTGKSGDPTVETDIAIIPAIE